MERIMKWAGLYLGLILLFTFAAQALSQRIEVEPVSGQNTVPEVVVIDPGHGGMDGGATSVTGRKESELNLEISLRLRDLLCLLGHEVIMVRELDVDLHTQGDSISAQKVSDLKNRVQLVNALDAPLLISIHQNYFPQGQYSGAQVFYAATEGSKTLAESLQSELITVVNPNSNRACKRAESIYLMENIGCTAVLVECGFLSNPQEAQRLETADYQQTLCVVLAQCIHAYLTGEGNMV